MTSYCGICKELTADTTLRVHDTTKVEHHFLSTKTTKSYISVPVCYVCEREFDSVFMARTVFGVLGTISLVALVTSINLLQSPINWNSDIGAIILGTLALIGISYFGFKFVRKMRRLSFLVDQAKSKEHKSNSNQTPPTTAGSETSKKFQLASENIIWIEKELLGLNKEIHGEDRPQNDLNFFQQLPKLLLEKDSLTTKDVEEAILDLVKQTRPRIGKMEVPFRKPRVIFTKDLPDEEPGHIEFGWDETIIRIHPKYVDNPFALASILCHELAHFILDQNGFRKSDKKENEKLTDLFVFKCGQGLIYLQGIVDVTIQDGYTVESRLGYLTLEEMAYAHVRVATQHGLTEQVISPSYFSGKAFLEVKKAIQFLSIKSGEKRELAEMILCTNDHVLRISKLNKSAHLRCPKCKWEKKIWIRRGDHSDALIKDGEKNFEEANFVGALDIFREAQQIDKMNSLAYCRASNCLKKLGKHQDAIKELQKLLSICSNDEMAQSEMKKLIF